MSNTKTKSFKLKKEKITEEEIQNLRIVSPIEFISKEENEHILEVLKQGLRDADKPEMWIDWEESDRILAKEIFNETV